MKIPVTTNICKLHNIIFHHIDYNTPDPTRPRNARLSHISNRKLLKIKHLIVLKNKIMKHQLGNQTFRRFDTFDIS